MALILEKNIALEPWRPGGLEIEVSRAVHGLRNLEKVKKVKKVAGLREGGSEKCTKQRKKVAEMLK